MAVPPATSPARPQRRTGDALIDASLDVSLNDSLVASLVASTGAGALLSAMALTRRHAPPRQPPPRRPRDSIANGAKIVAHSLPSPEEGWSRAKRAGWGGVTPSQSPHPARLASRSRATLPLQSPAGEGEERKAQPSAKVASRPLWPG